MKTKTKKRFVGSTGDGGDSGRAAPHAKALAAAAAADGDVAGDVESGAVDVEHDAAHVTGEAGGPGGDAAASAAVRGAIAGRPAHQPQIAADRNRQRTLECARGGPLSDIAGRRLHQIASVSTHVTTREAERTRHTRHIVVRLRTAAR